MITEKERTNLFLEGLKKLSTDTGITIGQCRGCKALKLVKADGSNLNKELPHLEFDKVKLEHVFETEIDFINMSEEELKTYIFGKIFSPEMKDIFNDFKMPKPKTSTLKYEKSEDEKTIIIDYSDKLKDGMSEGEIEFIVDASTKMFKEVVGKNITIVKNENNKIYLQFDDEEVVN